MDSVRLNALLKHQQSILSQIALDEPTSAIFENICLAIESIIEDKTVQCSILSLHGDQLFGCAAPSMDPEYGQLINGVKIGANVGSCGTAAHRKSRVIVNDIETSPLWSNFKSVALKFNLKSCWSTPIISSDSEVMGTFAIYHEHPCEPTESDIELIDYFVDFTRIALQKKYDSEKLKNLITELENSTNKFNALTKVIPDSAFILSAEGDYIDIYSSSEELLSGSISHLKGKNLNDILSKEDAEPIMAVIKKTLKTNEAQVFEYELEVPKGNVFFEGKTTTIEFSQSGEESKRYVLWMARDITKHKETEKEIEKLAYYDHLTDLPNRRLLTERLDRCIERISRNHNTGAILFIDLDKFKLINDSFGHNAGDRVLIEVARRLNSVVRSSDTIARIGGDEFIVLLEYVGDDNTLARSEAITVAEKLQQVFESDFDINNTKYKINASVGICLIDDSNLNSDNILNSADAAMYKAKSMGGNNYSFYVN